MRASRVASALGGYSALRAITVRRCVEVTYKAVGRVEARLKLSHRLYALRTFAFARVGNAPVALLFEGVVESPVARWVT